MSYEMQFEDMPLYKINTRKGGKVNKMTAKNTTNTEVAKTSKRYQKTRGEHFKDIIIAILVAGVIAFIAGVHYSDVKNSQMVTAVRQAQVTTPVVKK